MNDTNPENNYRLLGWTTEEENGVGATTTLQLTDSSGDERLVRVWMSEEQQLRLGMWLMARDTPEVS